MITFGEFIHKEVTLDGRLKSIFDSIDSINDYKENDITIRRSIIHSIKNFWNETNNYNRRKIKEMINNDIANVNRVYNMVLEYNKYK